ncbi:hypothetical protein FRC20_009125 [Serendipita sp. 405]|nr:hypothetical protein FRC20_009125 [Serendipita sp. 405]
MSQKPSNSPYHSDHHRAAIEGLVTQGLHALEATPGSLYDAEWRVLLGKLETLSLGQSLMGKMGNEAGLEGESCPAIDVTSDEVPKRLLRDTVAYLRVRNAGPSSSRDSELAKYNSVVTQVNTYCRKSVLSTRTSSSSPPTMASDKGSTSSLSAPIVDINPSSPSSMKFTFTRTHSNSFSVDVFQDEPASKQYSVNPFNPKPSFLLHEPPPPPVRRNRSESVPRGPPPARTRSASIREVQTGSLHGTSIDENAVQDYNHTAGMLRHLPSGPKPPVPKKSKHRHSRSLPALRVEANRPPPPLPQPSPLLSHSQESTSASEQGVRHAKSLNDFVHSNHLFLAGGHLSTPRSIERLGSKPPKGHPGSVGREHQRESWEIVPSLPPSKSHRNSVAHAPGDEPLSPHSDSKASRGLGLLKRRASKSQLSIKVGPLGPLSSASSPTRQVPIPVNVNLVVTGPAKCGVSTLIQRFIESPNSWILSDTVDDFWHHVVQSESRTIYYNMTEVAGAEEYSDLRKAVLRRAQVVLLCFRLDSRAQFRDAIVRIVEDIRTVGMIPIVLVGTFQDSPTREVTVDEAQTAAEALHASYFECSPPLGRGVQELFNHAATVLQVTDELRPTATVNSPPLSATRALFNLVRGRRSYSHSHASLRSQTHYLPHSASSKRQTFSHSQTPVPVLNIAPRSDATSGNLLLLGPQHFKCVIHGHAASGKKSLVHRYLHGIFEWIPEVPWMTWKAAVSVIPREEERRPSLPIAGTTVPYALTISEVASSNTLDPLRRSTYSGASIFVICFDVSDYREEVMREIKERWYEECRSYGPGIPVVLVATKIDQRTGTLRAWTKAQGMALSRSIRAAAYLECSAATGEGIEEVFQGIIRVATDSYSRP